MEKSKMLHMINESFWYGNKVFECGGIYKIVNLKNNKFYIGSAKKFNKRLDLHYWHLRNNTHHSQYLQRSFNKYGEECFIVEVLEIIEQENELLQREQFYLDALSPFGNKGYNTAKVAGSTAGISCSKETRAKISASLKGKFVGEKNPMYGRKLSEETRKKMSENKVPAKGESHGLSSTTEQQAIDVKILLGDSRLRGMDISQIVQVSTQVVSKIKNERTWSWLKVNSDMKLTRESETRHKKLLGI